MPHGRKMGHFKEMEVEPRGTRPNNKNIGQD